MASGWLGQGFKSLQGQLKEFTEEVLTETTAEVDDPETELQVAKKRVAELERRLSASEAETAEVRETNRVNAERAESAELQLRDLADRHRQELHARDADIRSLQHQLQECRDGKVDVGLDSSLDESAHRHHLPDPSGSPPEAPAGSWFSSSPPLSPDQEFELRKLRDDVKQLSAEVNHWKGLVQSKANIEVNRGQQKTPTNDETDDYRDNNMAAGTEEKACCSAIIDKHQADIAGLQAAHTAALRAQARRYEQQLARLGAAADSPSMHQERGDGEDEEEDNDRRPSTTVTPVETADDDWATAPGWADDDDGWTTTLTTTTTASHKDGDQDGGGSTTSSTPGGGGQLNERLEQMERRYETMQTEREEMLTAKRAIEHQLEEERRANRRMQATVGRLQTDGEEGAEPQTFEEACSTVAELRSEIESLKENLDVLDTQHEHAVEQLLKSKATAESKAAELTETVRRLERETDAVSIQHDTDQQALLAKNRQLAAENSELTSAYNDLNDEFEAHKAEYGSLVTSNRDLTDRIDSLKADLIEYEEKYEKCKTDNLATSRQLGQLTDQFDRLKYRLDSADKDSGDSEKTLMSEVGRLQSELGESLSQREKLAQDVGSFQTTVDKIDSELAKLRSSNQELIEENRKLRQSLESMEEMAASFRETESQVAQLKQSVNSYKEEMVETELLTQARTTEETERLQAQIASLQEENNELKSSVKRYRSVVGTDGAKMVEMKQQEPDGTTPVAGKQSSDDGTTGSGDSNGGGGGWDRLRDEHEVDIEEISSEEDNAAATGEQAQAAPVEKKKQPKGASGGRRQLLAAQLKEALAALNEKTQECEQLAKQFSDKRLEAMERDELLQQAFTELKGLEMQIAECRDTEAATRARTQSLVVDTARKDEEIGRLKADLLAAEERRLELDTQVVTLAGDAGVSDVTEQRLSELNEQVLTLGAERDRLEHQLNMQTEHYETASVETNVKLAEAERLLREHEDVMESQRATITELQRKLETIHIRELDVQGQLEQFARKEEELKQREVSNEQCAAMVVELENKVKESTVIETKLTETLSLLQAEKQELEDLSAAQKQQLFDLETLYSSEKYKTEEMQLAVDSAEKAMDDLIGAHKIEMDQIVAELHKVQSEQQLASNSLMEVEEMKRVAVATTESAMVGVSADVETKEKQIEQLMLEVNQLSQANQQLQTTLATQEEQMKNVESVHHQRNMEMEAFQARVDQLSAETVLLLDAQKRAEAEKQQLLALVNEKHSECIKYHQAFAAEQAKASSFEAKAEELRQRIEAMEKAASEGDQQHKVEIQQLTTHLQSMVSSAASEDDTLQNELRVLQSQKDRLTAELDVERKRAEELATRLTTADEGRTKTQRELDRLRAHLVQAYTREALIAEERETDLRAQLRMLGQEAEATKHSSHNSATIHQDQVEDLKTELASLASQRDAAVLELSDVAGRLAKNEKALSSLQAVTKEIQADSDKQTTGQVARMRIALKQTEAVRDQLQLELADVRQRLTDQDGLISQVTYLKTEVERRETDLRQAEHALTQLKDGASTPRASDSANGTKVDKELLKNLFLGYFSARKHGKQDEVAHLLGSILAFTAEDWKTVESASASGWLGFLKRGGGGGGVSTAEHSVTAEFIRFLEQESDPNRPPPPAPPVDAARPPMPLPDAMTHRTAPGGRSSSSRSSTPGFGLGGTTPVPQSTSLIGDFSLPSFDASSAPAYRSSVETSSEILKEVLSDD